ncbi:MAG: ATP-binding cassette domain-containing protein [Planctomycetota bacterium]
MIEVSGLCMNQGDFGLEGVSLTIPEGAYGVLMGRSGSGKTTVLEAICGLRPVQSGSIRLSGREVTTLLPGERGLGYVPQDRALFPGLLVRDQIAFALVVRQRSQDEIAERVDALAELLGISDLLDRGPEKLSGGEAQRVSLARALAAKPGVLCLDEPLSALDEETHDEICHLLKEVQSQTGVTVLHVTHSRFEAERLGTTFLRIEDGVVKPFESRK